MARELIDNYESGRGEIRGAYRTNKRVFLTESYADWQSDTDIPGYGDQWPDDEDLKVVHIGFEGAGTLDSTLTGIHKYTNAKVTVTYSTNPVNTMTLTRFDVSGELLEVGGFGTFSGSGLACTRPRTMPIAIPTKIIPIRSIANPEATIMGKLSKLNSDTWGSDGYTYAAETVWFAGAGYVKLWDAEQGLVVYETEYCFKINPYGWNSAWDGETGVMDTVLPKVFESVSFAGFPA